MELKWLEDFVALAESRNFSKAAVVRHTTQPAFSRRIKSLEAWYGVPLVDRSTYPVVLTAAGEGLLPLARQTVTELYRSRREARTEAGVAQGTVRFAMPHALAVCFFAGWWRAQPRPAETRAAVVAADLDDCVELLRSGACQYLLCYTHADVPNGLAGAGMQGTLLGTDRLLPVVLAGPDGRPLHTLPAPAGAAAPLLVYPAASFLGRALAGVLGRVTARHRVAPRYESALVEALKAEVLAGEGIAWLPERVVAAELAAGTLCAAGETEDGAADGTGLAVPLEIWLFRPPGAEASWPQATPDGSGGIGAPDASPPRASPSSQWRNAVTFCE